MAVTPTEVRAVARLARLAVPEAALERLARELSGILSHMDVLGSARSEEDTDLPGGGAAVRAGLSRAPLRSDVPADAPPVDIAALAPAVRDGFFTVPRLASHEDADT